MPRPAIPLTLGCPCPRCAGLVLRRHVVTVEGALTELYCVGCSQTSDATPERPYAPPRLRLSPSQERALNRICQTGCDTESSRRSREGLDGSVDIAVSRQSLDAVDIRTMFLCECQPDAHIE